MTSLGQAVKAAVGAVGGTYLDLADPVHGHSNFMASATDPNDAGYAAIAHAVGPLLDPVIRAALATAETAAAKPSAHSSR
jgi:hypothetical protein